MNLQARRKKGDRFTADDTLEVSFNTDSTDMGMVLHTVEHVSGPTVTHGGGGQSGDYLHYKAIERDADANGVIDYSDVEMIVSQEEKGTSVIKIVAKYVTKADNDADMADMLAWSNAKDAAIANGDSFTEAPPSPAPTTTIKTSDLTLEWTDDTFV